MFSNRGVGDPMSRAFLTLAFSIALPAFAVNARSENLSSVNKNKSDNASVLKDSVKDTSTELPRLIDMVMAKGNDSKLPEHLAHAVGLAGEVPVKDIGIKGQIGRRCLIAYDKTGASGSAAPQIHPVCLYLATQTRTKSEGQARIFRISLDGKLEKSVLIKGKYDAAGKAIPGSGGKVDQDVNSAAIKDAFAIEMRFWLKDWLKNQKSEVGKPVPEKASL
jgi:hypothetical protein